MLNNLFAWREKRAQAGTRSEVTMTVLAHPAFSMPAQTPAPTDDLLLKEANHRIANQLTLLASMIQIQARTVAKGPEVLSRDAVKMLLDQSQSRIAAMGKLHR